MPPRITVLMAAPPDRFRNLESLEHERAKAELKILMPDDAQQAFGHGVRAKRSKSGAVSFDLTPKGESHAAL